MVILMVFFQNRIKIYFLKNVFYIDKGDVFGWGNSEYSQFGNITNEKQLTVSRKLNMGQTGRIMKTAAGGTVCAVLNGKTYT